jgi:hypothetical protein
MSSPCCHSRRSRFRECTELTDPNLERQQSVLNLLQQFKGTEPLKQLFWSELNYERVNTQLSRRGCRFLARMCSGCLAWSSRSLVQLKQNLRSVFLAQRRLSSSSGVSCLCLQTDPGRYSQVGLCLRMCPLLPVYGLIGMSLDENRRLHKQS